MLGRTVMGLGSGSTGGIGSDLRLVDGCMRLSGMGLVGCWSVGGLAEYLPRVD